MASLPPPAELAALDLGWGDEEAETVASPPAGAEANASPAVAGAPSTPDDFPSGPDAAAGPDEAAELAGQFETLLATAEVAMARVAELEAELQRRSALLEAEQARQAAEHAQLLATLEAKFAERTAALELALAERTAELAAAQGKLAEAATRPTAGAATRSAPGAARGGGDDLQAIRGIGPKIAVKLGSLGITTYQQLAELGAGDLGPLAELLGVHQKRIERDGWVESARALLGDEPPPPNSANPATGERDASA